MAQYDDKSEEVWQLRHVRNHGTLLPACFLFFFFSIPQIHTSQLSDPTLLPYHKWMNERRTLSSVVYRSQTRKGDDPRRIMSEPGFRSYHRTATPLSDGRTLQSALSWQTHVQTNIDSPVRRLARSLSRSLIVDRQSWSSLFLVLNVITSNNNHKIPPVSIPSIIRSPIYVIVQQLHHHRHLPASPFGSWRHCVCQPNRAYVHSYPSLNYKLPRRARVMTDIAFRIKLQW